MLWPQQKLREQTQARCTELRRGFARSKQMILDELAAELSRVPENDSGAFHACVQCVCTKLNTTKTVGLIDSTRMCPHTRH